MYSLTLRRNCIYASPRPVGVAYIRVEFNELTQAAVHMQCHIWRTLLQHRGVISTFSWGAKIFLNFSMPAGYIILRKIGKNNTYFICSNLTLFIYSSLLSFFLFFLFSFSFYLSFFLFPWGGDGLPSPQMTPLLQHCTTDHVHDHDLNKYADDTYLIVPSSHSHTIVQELDHVSEWAAENNLKLNSSKSVELIIHRPRTRIGNCDVPPPSDGVTRLNNIKILGVIVTDTLSFEMHISGVISKCAQTSYALRIMRAHGLNGQALWDVTRSTLVSMQTHVCFSCMVWLPQ